MMLSVTASKPRMQVSAPYADHVSQPLKLPKFKFRVLGQKEELDIIHSTMFAITNNTELNLEDFKCTNLVEMDHFIDCKKSSVQLKYY